MLLPRETGQHKTNHYFAFMTNIALIIMAKEPRVGLTKTRLCPPLTFEEAAQLYEALLLDTIEMTSTLEDIDLAIAVTPSDSIPYFEQVSPKGTILVPVDCEDIGQCLSRVLEHLLKMGYSKAMALNSDGPSLPRTHIRQAVARLDEHDLVFGPSEDGGYYLVGLKEMFNQVFTDIEWSTSRVLSHTLAKCKNLELKVDLLPTWYDVDTAADIERLREELTTLPDHALGHTRVLLESSFGKRIQEEGGQA
jgi:rSAM/selenodomain-associated transferase 1